MKSFIYYALTGTLLLFQAHLLLAQTNQEKLSIGLVPTSLLDPITPSLGISVEVPVAESISLELVYGLDPNLGLNPTEWHPAPEFRHHEYRTGAKYIFKVLPSGVYPFVGAEYFGSYNHYEKERDVFHLDQQTFRFETAEVKRVINGGRLRAGMQRQMGKHFQWQTYLGIGVRNINIQYQSDNLQVAEEGIFDEWLVPMDRTAGRRNKIDMTFGVKLAYLIY